jgi:hypothetical protein
MRILGAENLGRGGGAAGTLFRHLHPPHSAGRILGGLSPLPVQSLCLLLQRVVADVHEKASGLSQRDEDHPADNTPRGESQWPRAHPFQWALREQVVVPD